MLTRTLEIIVGVTGGNLLTNFILLKAMTALASRKKAKFMQLLNKMEAQAEAEGVDE